MDLIKIRVSSANRKIPVYSYVNRADELDASTQTVLSELEIEALDDKNIIEYKGSYLEVQKLAAEAEETL